jgi:L-alanine-DL-glutamate epimerase-like enolase superfamily enzyme
MQLKDGRMWVSDRPGLGFSLSDQARAWTVASEDVGRQP